MNMIDITPVINAVIALLAAGVSVFLIRGSRARPPTRSARSCSSG